MHLPRTQIAQSQILGCLILLCGVAEGFHKLTVILNDADQRKNLFDFDQVLNTQRENVYASRRQALLADDLNKRMIQLAEKTSDDILEVLSPQVLLALHLIHAGLTPLLRTKGLP